jgi:ureidoacrylate peracid hydrolase
MPTPAEWIPPVRTALVIVDMQVDFAAPEGAAVRGGANLEDVAPALSAATRMAGAARVAGVVVVFVGLATRAETESRAWAERIRRRGGAPETELALCRVSTPGADFYGPTPVEGDLVIAKSRYSAFFDTDLDALLKARGVDTLVLCGVTTECCVDCTVRDAFHRDYHVFLAVDGCAAYDRAAHVAAVKALDQNFAIAVRSDAVVAAWTGEGDPGNGGDNHF